MIESRWNMASKSQSISSDFTTILIYEYDGQTLKLKASLEICFAINCLLIRLNFK